MSDLFHLLVALFELERGADASASAARVASTEVVEFENCTVDTWESPVWKR